VEPDERGQPSALAGAGGGDIEGRRGTFTSVKDLIAAIETFIDGWNERCPPFTWTKTADQILTRTRRGKRTSFARHL
jgi:hypothetical protein